MMRGNPKRKRTFILAFLIAMISLTAAPFATAGDITIWDKMGTNNGENNEVEPNCVALQKWDLEAFYLKGSKLYLIGGFDFLSGAETYKSGDIFIKSTPGAPIFGSNPPPSAPLDGGGYATVANGYGYNYVIDFARDGSGNLTGNYNVVGLTSNSILNKTYFSQNDGSNPFQYVSGGSTLYSSIAYTYYSGQTDAQVNGLLGDPISIGGTGDWAGTHNVLMIDLAFLGYGQEFYAHFTEGCGNDDLMGRGTIHTPEPGTMILLGSGLVGLAGWGRKKYRK